MYESAIDVVNVASPAPRSTWREVLAADTDALVTQSPEWLDCLVEMTGWRNATRLYEMADGSRLVMPAVSAAFSAIESSLPNGWGFGGLIGDVQLTARHISAVFEDLVNRSTIQYRIRPNVVQADLWAAAAPERATTVARRAHAIPLTGGPDAAFQNLERDTRRRIRRAESLGVEIEYDGTGKNVAEFHNLLMESIDRWAGQQHEPLALARCRAQRRDPLEKFESLARHLGPALQIGLARHEGRVVAANVVLMGTNAHATRAAMNKELAAPLSANALLEWKAIEAACERGCRYYHMGESGSSEALARHKRSYGAQAFDYSEFRIERLPISAADAFARRTVKRLIRFED